MHRRRAGPATRSGELVLGAPAATCECPQPAKAAAAAGCVAIRLLTDVAPLAAVCNCPITSDMKSCSACSDSCLHASGYPQQRILGSSLQLMLMMYKTLCPQTAGSTRQLTVLLPAALVTAMHVSHIVETPCKCQTLDPYCRYSLRPIASTTMTSPRPSCALQPSCCREPRAAACCWHWKDALTSH